MTFRTLLTTASAVALSFGLAAGAQANELTIKQVNGASNNVADGNQVGNNNGSLSAITFGKNPATETDYPDSNGDTIVTDPTNLSEYVNTTADDLDRTIEDSQNDQDTGDSEISFSISDYKDSFRYGQNYDDVSGSRIIQEGDENIAGVNSRGSGNFFSVVQDGDDVLGGDETAPDTGDSSERDMFTQKGDDNVLLADQTGPGNGGVIKGEQLSSSNVIVAKQKGDSILSVVQKGQGQNLTQALQEGGGNTADITQDGFQNKAGVIQSDGGSLVTGQ